MNILFLMADEFRFDAAGFMGNAVARTPHLDQLAASAVIFDNAYTPSPVCVPARQCLATGKYPLHIGCEGFYSDLPPNSPTFARWFSDHGYYTVACGKLHHRGPDQMQGWMHRIGSETAVRWPEAFSDRPQIGRRKWQSPDDIKNAGAGLSPLAIHDDYTVQGARDFLRMQFGGLSAVPADVPVLLMVSLQQPHFPLLTEPELLDYYHDRVPVFSAGEPVGHRVLDAGRVGGEQGITEADVRRATAAYYGMVEQTDRRIGAVLEALQQSGQDLAEWAVVFTSDHGDMLGEHGVWEKRRFFEGSARVPLFISQPGLTPSRSHEPANLVDLFPTLCHMADLPIPAGLDGGNLFDSSREQLTFSQYQQDEFMVRQGHWKYLHYAQADDVLFDLVSDPGETHNLINDPACAAVVAELKAALLTLRSTSCEKPSLG